ncbi:MAG TPA: hypothetical protein PLV42_03535 [bacterium]|nr:hypothetical protein [bacterium]
MIVVVLALGVLACGEKDTYTEKEYLEDAFLADCTKYRECDRTSFDNGFSSIEDCVEKTKKDQDIDKEDESVEYKPVCDDAHVYDPDAARRSVQCMYKEFCENWELGNIYDNDCALEEMVCLEKCTTTGEQTCYNNAVKQCNGQAWVIKENCDLTDRDCVESSGGKAACVPLVCEGSEMLCVGDLLLSCKEGAFEQTNCRTQQCNTCAKGKGCVPRDDACLTYGQTKCEGTKVIQCDDCDWIVLGDCADFGYVCIYDSPSVAGCRRPQ